MDIIFIKQLRIDTTIGVHDWERRIKQTVVLDIAMAHDIGRAAQSDELTHTVDYQAVAQRITGMVESATYQLVEALAEQVATTIQSEFSVSWLRLTVCKPNALSNAKAVGLTIERGKKPSDQQEGP